MKLKSHIKVAIIGTGTAALNAAGEVRRVTDDFIIVSNGIYGTTCVRAGCMPSKVLIHAASLCRQMRNAHHFGLEAKTACDTASVLETVRAMRGHFLEGALEDTEKFRSHIVEGKAKLVEEGVLDIDGRRIKAESIILATGSRPIVPKAWQELDDLVITSDTLFEQASLPGRIAVIGASVLGAEMAQTFARLGIEVTAVSAHEQIGGLSDPKVSACARALLEKELRVITGAKAELARDGAGLRVTAGDESFLADKAFVAVGRCANLETLGIEECGLVKEGQPFKDYNPATMQVGDRRLFIAGDVKLGRAVLHEATDEGRIAGYNAARETPTAFRRRVPLQICYTEPELAVVGTRFDALEENRIVIGEASYADQGRAKILGLNHGLLRVYADRESGRLLGAEMCAPQAEHLAHTIAVMIENEMSIAQALRMPFYHPTLEEGLRTALRHAHKQFAPDEAGAIELERLE